MTQYNVFHIKKPYHDHAIDEKIKHQWYEAIGQNHVLEMKTPKACIDVILGAIAITSGARNLQTYIEDMKTRGQDEERIKEVSDALKLFNSTFSAKKVLRFGAKASNKPLVEEEEKKFEELPSSALFQTIKIEYEKKEKSSVLDSDQRKYKESLKELNKLGKSIPEEFVCPLTGEILFDPVMTNDGNTYERLAIETWFENHDTSPLTSLKLSSKAVIPNNTLTKLIKDFNTKNKSA